MKGVLISIHTAASDFDDTVIVHLPSANFQGGYTTLCGLATDGDADSGPVVSTPANAQVTCPACYAMWKLCRGYTENQFYPNK